MSPAGQSREDPSCRSPLSSDSSPGSAIALRILPIRARYRRSCRGVDEAPSFSAVYQRKLHHGASREAVAGPRFTAGGICGEREGQDEASERVGGVPIPPSLTEADRGDSISPRTTTCTVAQIACDLKAWKLQQWDETEDTLIPCSLAKQPKKTPSCSSRLCATQTTSNRMERRPRWGRRNPSPPPRTVSGPVRKNPHGYFVELGALCAARFVLPE